MVNSEQKGQEEKEVALDHAHVPTLVNTRFRGEASKAWAPLPVPFWRVSLATLSSREPSARPGEQGEPR